MRWLLVVLLFFSNTLLWSQEITNISVKQEGKNVVVTYDLIGKAGVEYAISLEVSDDGGQTFGIRPKSLTGSVGSGILPGKNKKITWDVLGDVTKLTGTGFVFRIRGRGPGGDFGIEMVFVKGGTFQMGSNDGYSNEKPVHTVTVSDFYIGKYEITQKQWRELMGTSPSFFRNCDECPVESVSWSESKDFIKKLNSKTGKDYRMPYEAEWEYAARSGGKNEKWAGTNSESSLGQYAWYIANSGKKTHPVGGKKPNGLGIYDMSGNVEEFCEDLYDVYWEWPKTNPRGPSSGFDCVVRGGSWYYKANYCRAAARDPFNPNLGSHFNGFRLCLPVP